MSGDDTECPSGLGVPTVAGPAGIEGACSGDWKPADLAGVWGESVDDEDGASGDGVPLTNIDFVPSTNRPPRGGPSIKGGAKAADR